MCGVFCGQPDRKAECLGQTEPEFYIILKGEPPVTILLTIPHGPKVPWSVQIAPLAGDQVSQHTSPQERSQTQALTI